MKETEHLDAENTIAFDKKTDVLEWICGCLEKIQLYYGTP